MLTPWYGGRPGIGRPCRNRAIGPDGTENPAQSLSVAILITLITTTSLCKTFIDPKKGAIKAVDDVTFEAHPGQVFGLLGVNGAGKTTCLRMLSTVIRPTSGRATVAGHDIAKEPLAVRSKIGFLSASTALYGLSLIHI